MSEAEEPDPEVLRDEDLRARAIERIKKKRDFRTHLIVYVLVNSLLVVIWALAGADFFWPVFPILGWGIGLAMHAWDVYGPPSKGINEDQIRREMRRLKGDGRA